MEITLSLATVRRLLVSVLSLLILAGFCAEIVDATPHFQDPHDLVELFSLSYETNLPTWFASSLLFSCGLLLTLIALAKRRVADPYTRHWWGLVLAFLYISLDEFVQLHEQANHWFDFGGVLYYGWVMPAAVVVAILGFCYLGFLRHLPRRSRQQFVVAGALYVGGALGVELGLGYWADVAGESNLVYGLIDLVEESMEMCGVSLFFYALVELLIGPWGVMRVSLVGEGGAPQPEMEPAP